MAEIVGKIPEFTTDETPKGEVAEVKQPAVEEQPEEKETPASPPEEKPLESDTPKDDTPAPSQPELDKAIQGLQEERVKLLKEITDLRGQKREIKQEQIQKVEDKIDELKDLHPDDVAIIDRVLRGKGYLTKAEADNMLFEAVKREEINKFLEKYPEYKPENDRDDTNWNLIQSEMALYRTPGDARQIGQLLERAHRSIVKVPSERNIPAQKRAIEVASKGSGGVQRSSTSKTFDPARRAMFERGGWSEEEIRKMEEKL